MAAYSVFIPGYNGPAENLVTGGGLTARPSTGTLFQGVTGASAAAALAAVQVQTGTLVQAPTHTWLVSNDTVT